MLFIRHLLVCGNLLRQPNRLKHCFKGGRYFDPFYFLPTAEFLGRCARLYSFPSSEIDPMGCSLSAIQWVHENTKLYIFHLLQHVLTDTGVTCSQSQGVFLGLQRGI